ncbi:nuclear transport factor 2 family protein [Elioraea sp.]|uniref:nuclear transport factor 2 family protein n=1 Tax=Elioraea sp. TaxID=2185103 RepID=UPI003F6F36BB
MGAEAAEAEIAEALRLYFDGLHFSDVRRLARIFHPDARYVCATETPLIHLGMAEYFPIVAARTSPASRGERRRDRIVSIERAGPVTAAVRVECAIGAKFFTDLLTMIRVDGRWQIITKVFHYELEPEAV